MNLYVRYCIECGEAYDIGTEYDRCKKCRDKQIKEDVESGKQKTL